MFNQSHMDVHGANWWHGFELLEFSPIPFFTPQESKFVAGEASVLEKVLDLVEKIGSSCMSVGRLMPPLDDFPLCSCASERCNWATGL